MTPSKRTSAALVVDSQKVLAALWQEISRAAERGRLTDTLEGELLEAVRAGTNSQTKSYRYVLPTQLVAKLADPALDCRCLMSSRGGRGAFDARTVAHGVLVPFDQENNEVLGGSPEPYVNNPLRVPEISPRYRDHQKNRKDWDALCRVLAAVEDRSDPDFTRAVLRQALIEVHRRLAEVHVVYPAPKRISQSAALNVLRQFLSVSSGGDRLLAVTSAMFSVLGKRFDLFSQVRRSSITTADAASGLLADLECVDAAEKIILAVEVKDRDLTITHFRTTMAGVREKQVSEIFFIAQQGIAPDDRQAVTEQVEREFAAGHNVYITDIFALCETASALLGEAGRRDFVREIGHQLDTYKSDITHRRAWAGLLAAL